MTQMKIKAEFVNSCSFTRGSEHTCCNLCSGGYDKWTYQYAKVLEGPLAGLVLCDQCLKAAQDGKLPALLKGAAKMHEAAAKTYQDNAHLLRSAIGAEWDIPTFEEWKKREREADRQYCEQRQAG